MKPEQEYSIGGGFDSSTKVMVLENLVDTILESNKLYREIKMQLPSIYEEIDRQVKQELIVICNQAFNSEEWEKLLRKYPLDNLLKQLIYLRIDNLAAIVRGIPQSVTINSKKLRATTQLFNALLLSGRLKRPQRKKVDAQTYEDIWAESLAELWRFLCFKIDNFDDRKLPIENHDVSKFMIWINSNMYYIIKRCYFKTIDTQTNKMRENYQIINIDNHEGQEIPSPTKEIPFSEQIKELIEQDPENIFQNVYLRKQPQANFRTIALLSLEGKSMKIIAEKLGVPQQSLYSFYNRNIQRFMPTFHKYLLY